MKKKISIIFLLLVILLLNSVVYGATLNLDVKSDKENLEVDEEVTIKIDWKEGMQAADFILHYDEKKFEFVNINIDDNFYKVENGKVRVIWVSLDDTDKTSMDMTFKALKPGKAKFETEIDGGFATGELVLPDNYNTGNTIVKVNGITTSTYIIFGAIIAVILIFIIVFILKRTKRK